MNSPRGREEFHRNRRSQALTRDILNQPKRSGLRFNKASRRFNMPFINLMLCSWAGGREY